MGDIPGDLKFLSSHEWVRVEPDGSVTIGISDHAQDLLGDIVFVELPDIGQSIDAETDAAIVESVKAASDVYSPTLETSIGLARVDQGHGDKGEVMIRNKALNIDFVSPRFLRQGKI